ncbi:unnamed protein product [Phytophthora fragariaefolia]|uniref:Unnamed protein product n=1 Tax=Phytophthora fragariaefolia TaxID=1490495 RepID=A0A9W7CX94_9STRA|nr:unnamed protein product [Phytophthora fragariaefolia]
MSQEIPADPTWIVRPRVHTASPHFQIRPATQMGFRASWQKLRKEGWWSSRPTGLSSGFAAHPQAKSALPSAPTTAPAAPTQPAASAGQDPLADQVPAPAAPTQSTVQASVAPVQSADQAPAGAAHAPPAVQAASPPHSAARQSQPRRSTSSGTRAPSVSRQPARRRSKSSSDEGTGGGILDSDGENDDGNYTWDDESPVEDEDPDLDEEGPPPPEPLFDGALLTGVGGVGSIASGVIDAKVLKAMSTDGWSAPVTHEPYDYLQQPYVTRDDGALQREYPGLYSGAYGPTSRTLNAAATASGAFFYFVQPRLWEDIAEASNHYFQNKLDERALGQYEKKVARERKRPGYKKKTLEVIRNELQTLPDISARELCVFVGLLIGRAIAPNKEKLENHWKTTDEGGIPRGCFGKFMTRDRFMHLSRNLHFSSNDAPEASKTARGSYGPSSTHSRRGSSPVDVRSGAAAVIRNLRAVIGTNTSPTASADMRLVVTDRYYTLVVLSMRMLSMGFYSIGTVMTNRLGLCKSSVDKRKKRPSNIDRGTFTVVESSNTRSTTSRCSWDLLT